MDGIARETVGNARRVAVTNASRLALALAQLDPQPRPLRERNPQNTHAMATIDIKDIMHVDSFAKSRDSMLIPTFV